MHLRAGDAHGGVVVAEGAFYACGGGVEGGKACVVVSLLGRENVARRETTVKK